jgi:hypothetical protein
MDEDSFINASYEEVELYIGQILANQSFGNKSASDETLRALARGWFAAAVHELRDRLCKDRRLRILLQSDTSPNLVEISAALVDLLATQYWGGVSIAALSVMLVRYGYRNLCPEEKP